MVDAEENEENGTNSCDYNSEYKRGFTNDIKEASYVTSKIYAGFAGLSSTEKHIQIDLLSELKRQKERTVLSENSEPKLIEAKTCYQKKTSSKSPVKRKRKFSSQGSENIKKFQANVTMENYAILQQKRF